MPAAEAVEIADDVYDVILYPMWLKFHNERHKKEVILSVSMQEYTTRRGG